MPTIYDVSTAAGVSPKTVSRVLNGEASVRPQTRAKVEAAIERLGYAPSLAARSIRSRRSGLIGMVTGAISGPDDDMHRGGLPELHIVQAAQDRLEEAGKTLLIVDTGGDEARIAGHLRTLRRLHVEGVLVVAERHKEVSLPESRGAAPLVLVNCFDHGGAPAVLPDDERGQYDLASHVFALGHRRCAFLTLSPEHRATKLRLKGFRRAMAEAGIAEDAALVACVEAPRIEGERQLIWEALKRFLDDPAPPSVVFCGNDRLAQLAYDALSARSIAIPREMSVVGYDDHRPIARSLRPELTTVELPYRAMGARAAELMLELLDAPRSTAPARLVAGALARRQSLSRRDEAVVVELSGRTIR